MNRKQAMMKKNQIICFVMAAAILTSSCSSSYQAAGGLTGAMIGSHVGGTIGFLSGHGRFRGENAALGSLIGMGVGAILGVGVASQIEEQERAEARQYGHYPYDRTAEDDYYEEPDYQTSGGVNRRDLNNMSCIKVSDITYTDSNGDGYLSKGEIIEVEGYITNTSNSMLNDVVIVLNVDDDKACAVSPSLTTTLGAGQKIRYTGRIHCRKIRKDRRVTISLNTIYQGKSYTSQNLVVGMK